MIRMVTELGKFEGEMVISERLYSLEADGSTSIPDAGGYFGRYDAPFDLDDFGADDGSDTGNKTDDLTDEEKEFISSQAGAILSERSDGFVTVEWFDRRGKLSVAWENIVADCDSDVDEDSDDSDDDLSTTEIPSQYFRLCKKWYSGQDDMMYAIMSTGSLTRGSVRPQYQDESRAWRPYTDTEWTVSLWSGLSSDVRRAAQSAEKSSHPDATALRSFETWVDSVVEQFRALYNLEDSDVV